MFLKIGKFSNKLLLVAPNAHLMNSHPVEYNPVHTNFESLGNCHKNREKYRLSDIEIIIVLVSTSRSVEPKTVQEILIF